MQADDWTPVVLVIDRDDPIREGFCAELRAHGYRAICADTIRAASDHLFESLAVVLLCLDVPASRDAKLQLIEALPRGATLVLTGTDPALGRELGVPRAPFLAKPFGIEAFVEQVVESSRRRRTTM